MLIALLLIGMKMMFINPKNNDTLTITQVIDKVADVDVVIVGEKHDSRDCHTVELELFKALASHYTMVFSLEMFERDVQKSIDDYLNGRITEKEFLLDSRPWSNYKSDYRPMIEYAKKHNISVLAANIPRWIASMVAKKGLSALISIDSKHKDMFAKTVFYENQRYRKLFYATMEKVHMPGFSDEMKENYYKAQCLKDATMAESILAAIKEHKGSKVFHINGSFHSDYHLGVAYQLKKMSNGLKVLVISPVPAGEKKISDIGDFIYFYEQ